MTVWETYPASYRQEEVRHILSAVRSGACVSVVGLSGAGKSNLLGFMAHREDCFPHPNVLVDCNRLQELTPEGFFRLVRQSMGDIQSAAATTTGGNHVDEFGALEALINRRLEGTDGSFCLLLDRFDILTDHLHPMLPSNLRALRDAHKYQLTFVTATRQPLNQSSELAELFYAHTLWLGPLSFPDVVWNVERYAGRLGQTWGKDVIERLRVLTHGYPSLLRAACQAFADGTKLELEQLKQHPAVRRRVDEFWLDNPADAHIRKSGLQDLPLLEPVVRLDEFDTTQLTAKEALLFEYLRSHPEEVCTKDELVQAVWPEDRVFEIGVRDDSLAQLVRRTRVKIEPDPSSPKYIHTVPGRGYKFTPRSE
jgi:hypothetical protein